MAASPAVPFCCVQTSSSTVRPAPLIARALLARIGATLALAAFVILASTTTSASDVTTPTPKPTSPAAADASAPAATPPAAPALRSLRDPLPEIGNPPPPTVPEAFTGTYPGAMPYAIVPRKPELPLHPCSMCHNLRKPDPTVRTFKVAPPPDGAPHAGRMRHGKGRIWCLDCHYANDREWLRTVDNKKIDFNDAPLQCGQCHSARYRDWVFGGHGKRVEGWIPGERTLYSCVHCHDPHIPVLPARAPSKPPPVRAGLTSMVRAQSAVHAAAPWVSVAPAPAVDSPAATAAAPAAAAPAAAQGKADGKEAKR